MDAQPKFSNDVQALPKDHQLSSQILGKIKDFPKLSRLQCGHLRHFYNLASTIDGDWGLLGSQEPGQEWDTAYRYQLSAMTYAAGAAYYHRLPVARSMFKELIEKLISKMLRREVWGYWYMTSQSGINANPDIKELRKPWADPVCKENIMYSGHLLLMTSLYTMLFQDRRFDELGSIQFDWNPMWFGMGQEVFKYSRPLLQETILKEMEREGFMGVCCEPNMIFIVCNQFPLIAMRYNDVIDGKNVIGEVLPKYRAAWADKGGMISENGLFRRWYAVEQDNLLTSSEIGHSAWIMTYMAWNHELVQSMYRSIGKGFFERKDSRINIHPPVLTNAIHKLARDENRDPDDPAIISRAKKETAGQPPSQRPYLPPTFGWVAQWFSEIAGSPDLDALLVHADKYLQPTWRDGGLYYKRNDAGWDDEGNYIHVDPYIGNAAIGYARLNVKGGQKKMWDHPWTEEEVRGRPWVDGLSFGQDVDCLRAHWDGEEGLMVVTLRTWNGERFVVHFDVNNLPAGRYGIYSDGELQRTADTDGVEACINISLEVGDAEVDLIILRLT